MDIQVTSGPNPGGAIRGEITGPITEDILCRHCGYNLRGLSEMGACPECGTAVGRSLLGDQLRFSDPVWVRKLAKGMTWIMWGFILSFLLMALVMVFAFAAPNLDIPVMSVLGLVPSLVMLVGYWMVTTPEPGVMDVGGLSLRSFVRWPLITSTVISLTTEFITTFDPIVVESLEMCGSLIGLAGLICLFVYARRLALRVPDENLARQTGVVMWGWVISLGVIVVSAVIEALTTFTAFTAPASGLSLAVLVPICMASVGCLVFAIWSLVLVVRYYQVASAAANSAEQTWAQGI